MENKHTSEDLKIMQSWDLDRKIQVTQARIMEWYKHFEGQVYVSFSGGKDSTVLLDLARRIYSDIEAVFVDTGLEYPEIREFVKSIENTTWLKPKMPFNEVIKKYGYPIISKEVSRDISVARRSPNGKTAQKFISGSDYHKKYGDAWLLEKWNFLKNSNIPISNSCCKVMKKTPFLNFEKESDKKPFIGTTANESRLRKKEWLAGGCNSFDAKKPSSKPISFWTEQDVLMYIKRFNIPYAKVYGDIIEKNGKLETTGVDRTGCMFCMFGVYLEQEPNRFQRMKETHPQMYKYCIEQLGLGEVLDYIKVKY